MKTLIVSYLPRGGDSQTRRLVEAARQALPEGEIEHLELSREAPPLFLEENLQAYVQRNYKGASLTTAQRDSMAVMDRMAEQLLRADQLILALPMYNFSMPAAVKAWVDAVAQKGRTWEMGPDGYRGLMAGRPALVLVTSGGEYEGAMASWEHAESLARVVLTFLGFEPIESVRVAGINSKPELLEPRMEAAVRQVEAVVGSWQCVPV